MSDSFRVTAHRLGDRIDARGLALPGWGAAMVTDAHISRRLEIALSLRTMAFSGRH